MFCTALVLGFAGMLLTPYGAGNAPGTLEHLRWGDSAVRYGLPFLGILAAIAGGELARLERLGTRSRVMVAALVLLCTAISAARFLAKPSGCALTSLLLTGVALFLVTVKRKSMCFKIGPRGLGLSAILLILGGAAVLWGGERVVGRHRDAQRGATFGRWHCGIEPSFLYRWFDENVSDACVWVCNLRAYPFYGRKFSNRVRLIPPDRLPTIPDSSVPYGSPDLIVVGVSCEDTAAPNFGLLPDWVNQLETGPERWRIAFADQLARVYILQTTNTVR